VGRRPRIRPPHHLGLKVQSIPYIPLVIRDIVLIEKLAQLILVAKASVMRFLVPNISLDILDRRGTHGE
jgi:hypothetical protein